MPAFPCEVAKQIVADELTDGDVSMLPAILSGLDNKPVAAASLGQVGRPRHTTAS